MGRVPFWVEMGGSLDVKQKLHNVAVLHDV